MPQKGRLAMNTRAKSGLTATVALAALIAGSAAGHAEARVVGHLYTLNNDGQANAVLVLDRRADGSLKESAPPVTTGGAGLVVPSGGDFDTQGAVRIVGRHLLAVNPGSNSIAVFDITKKGKLKAVPGSPFASGGSTPLSIAVHGDLVYVANQAVPFANPTSSPNITAFRLSKVGRLTPIAGSTVEFPPGQGPGDVEFNPSGTVLAVTAGFQSTGDLHTYAVQADGLLKEGPGSPSKAGAVSGTVGFSWAGDGRHVMVSNFRGSAVTVFSVDPATAAVTPEGMPYPNNQGASCWTTLAPDGKTLYTANFVSNTISAYSVAADGKLMLLGSAPKRSATHPDSKDLEVSPDGKYLYLVGPLAKQISVFALGKDGLPKEMPQVDSPYTLKTGQWTTGLALN
jgi:6-phosphogluconolactonase (cycloisomerase 2 family)